MHNSSVRIVEVGPRDGLQNIKTPVSTSAKLELISRLRKTGLRTIELSSLVSPRAVPQLADSRQLLSDPGIQALLQDETSDLRLPVLLPNLKGLRTAIELGLREVAVFISASEGFSKANINCSVDESLDRIRQVVRSANLAGIEVRGYISCIFEDPFDGPTPRSQVVRVVNEMLAMGCYEVSLGDTLGVGTPPDVQDLLAHLKDSGVPMSKLAGHFHDTYGTAIANVWQAYQSGVRVFDSSVAGLGGCPYCPGARGNVSTEDLVFMFERARVSTGVDLSKLAAVGEWVSRELALSNASRAGMAILTKQRAEVNRAPSRRLSRANQITELQRSQMSRPSMPIRNLSHLLHLLQVLWRSRHGLSAFDISNA